jgi:hypothetical protein
MATERPVFVYPYMLERLTLRMQQYSELRQWFLRAEQVIGEQTIHKTKQS